MYYVYMLRCRGDTLYTGITPDVCRRMQAHASGKGARYTRSFPPVALAALWRTEDKSAAARLEYAVKKKLDRAEKERLLADPARLETLLPEGEAPCVWLPGVTLEQCLEGAFHG